MEAFQYWNDKRYCMRTLLKDRWRGKLKSLLELGTAMVSDDGGSWTPLAVGGDVFVRTVGGDQRRSPAVVVTWCAGWKWWQRCDGERQELVAEL
ncbi:hypothetical protein E3N88_15900 [Mikania micrantha]|uniref:Uncharacterized protein n=1 Tax=Mikania micrantha TaxID=192012 RepID=A0A5N6NWQ4_9ASTR|nr:hypothetical protein E3N88_15900 [Mikania micrantha]